jgi:hypothetical protein
VGRRPIGPGIDPEDEPEREIDQSRAEQDRPRAATGGDAEAGIGVGVLDGRLEIGVVVRAFVGSVLEQQIRRRSRLGR